ncbi:ABC-F family ATP-binding cassette domain-containing protein [Apilactobacillus apisilvae]|uniref:ABC-F family ATP-binding cassette domain-containing protein n=1 Tax=Apilactobacillus apisilvae TaxID=2923364 RepID=A0ABY4PI13_9LACO|nr:ABC-F family ATP-binding cassette domain-containing protein [Apilactobacillus apisilvae]UQS85066.1 ABC-F family ATP-binding cassette domain-containing protein [Apilactobacillus apisilvae]
MILLQANKLTKRFGGEDLFTNVNLSIPENGKVALVGRNGAGKSTLVKMIMGIDSIDEGNVTTKNGLTIGYLAQNTGLKSNRTIIEEMESVFKEIRELENKIHSYENKMASNEVINNPKKFQKISKIYDRLQSEFLSKNGFGYEAEIRSVLAGFGFKKDSYNHKINELSGGQQTQLAMAKLLLEKRDLLILDEPTNHIDVKTIAWLEDYIKGYPGALLIISHDRYFMDKIVDKVYDLNHGHLDEYNGDYSNFIEQKQANYQIQLKNFEKQQKEIHKMEDFVNKNIVRASTTKRAQARRKQLEKMDRIDSPEHDEKAAKFSFSPYKQSGNVVLKVSDLKIGYEHEILSSDINLDIKKHQAVALIGPNGVGKSTLLKTIIKKLPKIDGKVQLGTGVQIGYYDQHQDTLHRRKNVLDEIWDDYPTETEQHIRSILGSFLFSGNDVDKTVGNLSGGEKARLLLTKLSMNHDNFLILDEPTNHLDIDSREVLENALKIFDGTILFVSHDRYFINKIATSIVELSESGSNEYLGNYDYYVEKKEEQEAIKKKKEEQDEASSNDKKPKSDNQKQFIFNKSKQKEERKIKRSIEKLENELETLNKNKEKIEKTMVEPEVLQDIGKLQDLQNQLNSINKQIDSLEDEWTEYSLKLEE